MQLQCPRRNKVFKEVLKPQRVKDNSTPHPYLPKKKKREKVNKVQPRRWWNLQYLSIKYCLVQG